MQTGELARAAGVNIQTIRFYEREKLLRLPRRTPSGYRDYTAEDLNRVLFIRRNQEIGFTLAEIRQLLELHGAMEGMPRPFRRKPDQVREIVALGQQRIAQLSQKIRNLQTMKEQLEFVVRHLEQSAPTTCPVSSRTNALQLSAPPATCPVGKGRR